MRGPTASGLGLRVQEAVDADDDRRGVEPARQARPHRHVAAQVKPQRVDEELPHGFRCVAAGRVLRFEAPVPERAQPRAVEHERMGGRKGREAGEERLVRVIEIRLLEVVEDRAQIRLRSPRRIGEKRLRLAREDETSPFPAVVEGLDPEPVAGAEEPATVGVPERERPHAVEALDAALTLFPVGGEDHLRVGPAPKAVPFCLELPAELAVVVDLAVVDELEAAIVARERLVAGRRRVDDREPAEAECYAVGGEGAGSVGSAMGERRGHPLDGRELGRPVERDDAADSTHGPILAAGSSETVSWTARAREPGPARSSVGTCREGGRTRLRRHARSAPGRRRPGHARPRRGRSARADRGRR